MARSSDEVGLLEGLATTRSIRRYRAEPIPDDDLAAILWHASRAPSGSNSQPTRYVVLRDGPKAREAKALLGTAFRAGWAAKVGSDGYDRGSALDPASPKGRQAASMQRFVDRFEEVPVVVLPCVLERHGGDISEGASVYPACQNLLLAARALGYGGVLTMWHGLVEAELRELLAIPDRAHIAGCIPLGKPEGNHGPVRRRPLAEVVFDDSWGEPATWAVDPEGTRFAGRPPRDVGVSGGRPR